MKRDGKRHRLWPKLLLSLGTVCVLLLAIEIYVRVACTEIVYVPMLEVMADEELGYRLRPGYEGDDGAAGRESIRISEQGHRDDVYGQKEPGELRILVLGDSFTYGKEVERGQLYTELLESALLQKLGRSVDVLNTGVPSWATFQQARLLARIGEDYRPNVVLLQYYDNDLYGNRNHHQKGTAMLAQGRRQQSFGGKFTRIATKYSHAVRLLWVQIQALKKTKIAAKDRVKDPEELESPERYWERLCLEFVEDIREETRRLGAAFALFVIEAGAEPGVPHADPAGHFLNQYARTQDIPALSFTQAVRRADADFPDCATSGNNAHFSTTGHRVAAQQLEKMLGAAGLLTP